MPKQLTTDSGKVINYYKTAFISDVHLSNKECRINDFIYFLDHNHFDTMYIIGDFIDGWSFSSDGYWEQEYSDAISKLLKKTRNGTKIFYIIGNHDEFLNLFKEEFGNISIVSNAIYETQNKKLMVMHGHEFDSIINNDRWIVNLGLIGYKAVFILNKWIISIRRLLGLKYWSLSKYVKNEVKDIIKFIDDYELLLKKYIEKYSLDGIICGHLHQPALSEKDRIIYMNTGDFVENSTAICEDFDGTFYLIDYAEGKESSISSLKIEK